MDRGKQRSLGFLEVAPLLLDELGVRLDFSKQLADAGHVHALKAQRSALDRQKTREGSGKHFAGWSAMHMCIALDDGATCMACTVPASGTCDVPHVLRRTTAFPTTFSTATPRAVVTFT